MSAGPEALSYENSICLTAITRATAETGEAEFRLFWLPIMQDGQIVIDSSVLVRVFNEDDIGHADAAKLGHYLVDNGIRVRIPYHALFEISSAFKHKRQTGSINAYQGITEGNPLQVDPVAVDAAFFSRYFDASLPYLKAGDSLFLAMAKKDSAILITEDNQQYAAAQSIGVQVFRVTEFLARGAG